MFDVARLWTLPRTLSSNPNIRSFWDPEEKAFFIFAETVTVLARQSENKTLTLFDQVYRSMAVLSRPSILALYQAMVDYVSPINTPDDLQQPLTRETLQERFIDFFTRLFPIAYHHAINPDRQDFTEKFKTCLYEAMNDIQPFGDIPEEISKSVSKSLEATRVLVQALTLGKTVLDRTDSVLFAASSGSQQDACYEALLRMTYCPRCKGIGNTVRPCSGFCTNVIRWVSHDRAIFHREKKEGSRSIFYCKKC